MGLNTNLHAARRRQNDEFYTQLSDIENELRHYTPHFENKVVYCNCDDPRASNFFKYFHLKFGKLGLRGLITTCYQNPSADLFSRNRGEKSVGIRAMRREHGRDQPDAEVFQLNSDGDFRSVECVELLKEADIVVTNPPFSLFREYVAQLMQYRKEFLIVGSQNAVTYKEIFPLIKDDRMWLGITPKGRDMLFDIPESYAAQLLETAKEGSAYRIVDGVVKGRLGNAAWFTNLDHARRHEPLILYRRYSPEEYPCYDNYDAINVDRLKDIPKDYSGPMGVPITILDQHNPDQFEILGIANSARYIGYECFTRILGRKIYNRVIIRNRRLRQ